MQRAGTWGLFAVLTLGGAGIASITGCATTQASRAGADLPRAVETAAAGSSGGAVTGAPTGTLAAASAHAGAAQGAAHVSALPFINDDYAAALAEAKRRNVPLFVEMWAPWCHTCVFMRAYVFTDSALAKHAGRFVWLAIDIDKAENAPFLGKFETSGIPTSLVIDPSSEKAALKWLGSANVGQIGKLLEDGERAIASRGTDAAETALALADRLHGEGKAAESVPAYREALEKGGAGWSRRPRALESLIGSLQASDQAEECAKLARKEAPGMPRGSSFGNVTATGLGCALGTPWGAEYVAALEPLVKEAVKLEGLLADDRSSVYGLLVDAADARGDAAAATALATEWLVFLETEAAKAPNPQARAVFDPHRVLAALKIEQPGRVVDALKASERDLPGDYNPPYRLAIVYQELGKSDEALAASQRALALAYGPRRVRVYEVQAGIFEKKGDKAAARGTLEDALKFAKALPEAQRSERTVTRLQERIDALK